MFSLLNINKINTHLAIGITNAGETIEFTIGPLISKRNKEELIAERQFELMNAYLDYKGNDYKSTLYQIIVEASYAVEETIFTKGLTNPPTAALYRVIDYFDLEDIKYFIKSIYGVKAPENLRDNFDPQIESDGLGTRIQTYLKDDYYDLAALTIPIKAVIGLLGQYAIRKDKSIALMHREYVLCGLLSNHPIMKHPAIIKLLEWSKVLIDLNIQDSDTESITVIEKQIPSSELPRYLLYVVIIQKLSIAAIVTDNRERNVITRIYNYIINKLKTKGGASTKIRDKRPLPDADSASGDKESIVESYRIVSNITIGTETEFNWYMNNLEYIIRDIGYPVDKTLLNEVIKKNQCFKTVPISRDQVAVASYLFKDIIDPRSFDYIGIDGIINMISAAFTVYWMTNHKEMAMFITSRQVRATHDVIDINITPNIRIDPVIKKQLAEVYPYNKQLSNNRTESVIEAAITELTYSVFKHKWLPNAPESCIKEHFGDGVVKVLTSNFKNNLGRLILDLESWTNNKYLEETTA